MTSPSNSHQILFVDDEPAVRQAVSLLLGCAGYTVETASSGEDALARLQKDQFDLLITDNFMPGMSGVELAEASKARVPSLPIVMFTAYPPATPPPCLDLVLVKPHGGARLIQSVKDILQREAA
jgi:CheY-like chemotaxis protein